MDILIVDDDEHTRRLLTLLFHDEGHAVDACADGAEALARLAGKTYTALVTDFVMPGMNGIELVREALTRYTGLLCVIISGRQKPPVEELGDVPWFAKPLDFDALLASLEARLSA